MCRIFFSFEKSQLPFDDARCLARYLMDRIEDKSVWFFLPASANVLVRSCRKEERRGKAERRSCCGKSVYYTSLETLVITLFL